MPQITRFPRLQAALSSLQERTDPSLRVFARDRDDAGAAKGSKTFCVATYAQIYFQIAAGSTWDSYYETLNATAPSRWFLDFEFEVCTEEQWADIVPANLEAFGMDSPATRQLCEHVKSTYTEGIAQNVWTYLDESLRAYCKSRFDVDLHEAEIKWLTASNCRKISFHAIIPIRLDSHVKSGAALAFDFGRALRERIVSKTTADLRLHHLICLQLNKLGKSAWACDLAPYGRNQQFRCPGNTKAGQRRPLLPMAICNFIMHDLNSQPDLSHNAFSVFFNTLTSWKEYLVQADSADDHLAADGNSFVVQLPTDYPYATVRRAYSMTPPSGRESSRSLPPPPSAFKPDGTQAVLSQTQLSRGAHQVRPHVHSHETVKSILIEDTATIVTDDGITISLVQNLAPEQVVFCPRCETVETGIRERPVQGFGTPSATCISTPTGGLAIYCFNCLTALYMASTFQQPLMEVRPEEVVQLHRPEDRINSHGRQDVIIKDGISVFAMSALTGLGKTTLVKQYLQDHPALSVLSLTYRKCMAASAAEVLQLEYYENERARTAERISTTIHSLPKLRRLQYDVVIADEADSLRNVGAESTMDDRYEACMAALAKYLETAKLVILLQADLTETVISWICGFMKVDSMDRRFVQRVRIESLRGLWPVGLAEDLAHTLGEAKRMYKEQQELPVGARKPMMMFFTHVRSAFIAHASGVLISYLQARTLHAWHANALQYWCLDTEAQKRIKVVSAAAYDDPDGDDYARRFIAAPNAPDVQDVDVVMVSPVVAAGVSVDYWVRASFWILQRGVHTHTQEFQLTQRWRTDPARDNHPNVVAYIEPGVSDQKEANVQKLGTVFSKLAVEAAGQAGMQNLVMSSRQQVMAEQMADRADTTNRHKRKWEERFEETNSELGPLKKLRTAQEEEEDTADIKLCGMLGQSRTRSIKNWHTEPHLLLADPEGTSDREVHPAVMDLISFEAASAKNVLEDRLKRRFPNPDFAAFVAIQINSLFEQHPQVNWLSAYKLARYLDFFNWVTEADPVAWKARCKGIASFKRSSPAWEAHHSCVCMGALMKWLIREQIVDSRENFTLGQRLDLIKGIDGSDAEGEDGEPLSAKELRAYKEKKALESMINSIDESALLMATGSNRAKWLAMANNTLYKFFKRQLRGVGLYAMTGSNAASVVLDQTLFDHLILVVMCIVPEDVSKRYRNIGWADAKDAVARAEAETIPLWGEQWSNAQMDSMQSDDGDD